MCHSKYILQKWIIFECRHEQISWHVKFYMGLCSMVLSNNLVLFWFLYKIRTLRCLYNGRHMLWIPDISDPFEISRLSTRLKSKWAPWTQWFPSKMVLLRVEGFYLYILLPSWQLYMNIIKSWHMHTIYFVKGPHVSSNYSLSPMGE